MSDIDIGSFNPEPYPVVPDIQAILPIYMENMITMSGLVPMLPNGRIPKEHQVIASRYFVNSDVKALLLYHETGTGKTWVFALVARYYSKEKTFIKRSLVLCKSPTHINNIKGGLLIASSDLYDTPKGKSKRSRTIMTNKNLKDWFDFGSYASWCANVLREIEAEYGDLEHISIKRYVRKTFRNLLIIMDEFHNVTVKHGYNEIVDYGYHIKNLKSIKEDKTSDMEKSERVNNAMILRIILYIRDFGKDCKIIVGDATLANDNIESFKGHGIILLDYNERLKFVESDLKEMTLEKFNKFFYGKISRVEASSQKTVKVYPKPLRTEKVELEDKFTKKKRVVTVTYNPCYMSDFQEKYLKKVGPENKSFYRSKRIASLCVPPSGKGKIQDFYKTYVIEKDGDYILSDKIIDYLNSEGSGLEQKIKKLEIISAIYAKVMKILLDSYFYIKDSEGNLVPLGVITIYLPSVHDTGAIFLGLLLEEILGYSRFTRNDIGSVIEEDGRISISGKLSKKLRYALLTDSTPEATTTSSKNVLRSTDNFQGGYIRAVIISKSGGEGSSVLHGLAHIKPARPWSPGDDHQAESRIFRENSADDLISFIKESDRLLGTNYSAKYLDSEGRLKIRIYELNLVSKSGERQLGAITSASLKMKEETIRRIGNMASACAVDAICNKERNSKSSTYVPPYMKVSKQPTISDNVLAFMGSEILSKSDTYLDTHLGKEANALECMQHIVSMMSVDGTYAEAIALSSIDSYLAGKYVRDTYGNRFTRIRAGDYIGLSNGNEEMYSKIDVLRTTHVEKISIKKTYKSGQIAKKYGDYDAISLLSAIHSSNDSQSLVKHAIEVVYGKDKHDKEDFKICRRILKVLYMTVIPSFYPSAAYAYYLSNSQKKRERGAKPRFQVSVKLKYDGPISNPYENRNVIVNTFDAIPNTSSPSISNVIKSNKFSVYNVEEGEWEYPTQEGNQILFMAYMSLISAHYNRHIDLATMRMRKDDDTYFVYGVKVGNGPINIVNLVDNNFHHTGSKTIENLQSRKVYREVMRAIYPIDHYGIKQSRSLMKDLVDMYKFSPNSASDIIIDELEKMDMVIYF